MSVSVSWDSISTKLDFPYNRILSELDETPRFIAGRNTYVTTGGKLARRPGTVSISNSSLTGRRMDRLWIYQTLDITPRVYFLASVYNFSNNKWELWYLRPDDAVPAWTLAGSYRSINVSDLPHEIVISRGLAYVKSWPILAGEKLGTVIFDGTGGTVSIKPWGILGPTEPAALVGAITRLNGAINSSTTSITVVNGTSFSNGNIVQIDYEQMTITSGGGTNSWTVTRGVNGTTAVEHEDDTSVLWRNWSASDHRIDVNVGWAYSYCYKTITGQYSNRAPLQTNPDKLPSLTGPFFDQIPKITVSGHSDTTNVPTIVILRTSDGGGTFYVLEEIPNTGASSITYLDDSLESGTGGGTFNDPLPDEVLQDGDFGPTLTSNSPPPANVAPLVTGVDPIEQYTPLAYYAGRIWYGVQNVLFFSAQEEAFIGIPEETFPSGVKGNFFRFQYHIRKVVATSDSLYILTTHSCYQLTGNNLETFNVRTIYENIGAANHPRSATTFADKIAFLTHDYRIAIIEDGRLIIISDPLYTDLVDSINEGGHIDIKYWADLDKEFLVISSHNIENSALSRQWIYDLKQSEIKRIHFWNCPWTIKSSVSVSGRINETSEQRRLVFFVWNSATNNGELVRIDPTLKTYQDWFENDNTNFDVDFTTSLMQVPPGNHVNQLRVPTITPKVYDIRFEITNFGNEDDPQFYYFLDDFWSDPAAARDIRGPARRRASKGYRTILIPVNEVAQRVAIKVTKYKSPEPIELQNMTICFDPTNTP